MPDPGEIRSSLEQIVSPYLEITGVRAAALVSTDGLLVAAVGGWEFDLEAVASHAAAVLSSVTGLATELGGFPRIFSCDLTGQGLILAPLTDEVFLALWGGTNILALNLRPSVSL